MGVPGFTTFLDNNNHLLSDFKLRDVKLVIDGNNLLHFLYKFYQVPYSYGGDYKIFADSCKHFFSSFIACNVVPYVVFDGAYDLDGKKFKSSRFRTAKKVEVSISINKDRCTFLLPLLSQEVFKETLDELSIKHVTCNYEADRQIASLAAVWECPVLTNDSDFFIFNLPGGVILLDYLNVALKEDKDGSSYMNVQLYSIEKLKKEMGIYDQMMIFLFATIMGNDIISGDIFNPFCKKLNYFSHVPGIKLNQIPNHRRKILGLLKWLALKRNLGAAVRDILFELKNDSEQKVKDMINKSIENYSLTDTYLDCLFDNYDNIFLSLTHYTTAETGKLTNKENQNVPSWFKMQFNKGLLNSKLANVFVSREILLQPQIENKVDPSSYECSNSIRQLIYGLLIKPSENLEEIFEVTEHMRVSHKLEKIKTTPRWILSDNISTVQLLGDIFNLKEEEKRALFLDPFRENEKWFLKYPQEEQFFLAVVTFWCSHAKPNISKIHVWAMLISFYAVDVIKMFKDPYVNSVVSDDIENTVSEYLGTTKGRKKYFEIFDLQGFAQFQACFLSLWELNRLLQKPFKEVSLASFYSGSNLLYIYYHLELEIIRLEELLKEVFVNNKNKLYKMMKIFENLNGLEKISLVKTSLLEIKEAKTSGKKNRRKNKQ